MGIVPVPISTLGHVQCMYLARFSNGIRPIFSGSGPNAGIGPGAMWGLGQVQY